MVLLIIIFNINTFSINDILTTRIVTVVKLPLIWTLFQKETYVTSSSVNHDIQRKEKSWILNMLTTGYGYKTRQLFRLVRLGEILNKWRVLNVTRENRSVLRNHWTQIFRKIMKEGKISCYHDRLHWLLLKYWH